MKLTRIIERVTARPWLITSGGYDAIEKLITSKLSGSIPDFTPATAHEAGFGYVVDRSGIACTPVFGTLANRIGMIEKICGGCDYQDLENAINGALDDGAKGFMFHFDSPGGECNGCGEIASVIAGLDVPKVAFTDSMCCSAAYYMASGCDYIVATPSASVGSIGCIIPWVDKSQAWASLGLKFDPITGEEDTLKSTGHGPSLTNEQRQYLQDSVDAAISDFRNHVSSFRDVDFDALKGGAYEGQKAIDFNLVDKIGTYADAYELLISMVS
jgi:capsid assembly protease